MMPDTAATVLLILGVTERAAMGVMGWATTAMAARYQHLTDRSAFDIAERVGGLIWETPKAASEASRTRRRRAARRRPTSGNRDQN